MDEVASNLILSPYCRFTERAYKIADKISYGGLKKWLLQKYWL